MINAASLSESGRKLGGLNLTLWLSAIAIAVTVSVYNILQKNNTDPTMQVHRLLKLIPGNVGDVS